METSNKTALYVSVPLDPSRRQIRLLRILSTEPTLVCRFDVASLDTSVTYCALSYVWGDPTASHPIYVNNTTIYITKSLHETLGGVHAYLRRQEVASDLSTNVEEWSPQGAEHSIPATESSDRISATEAYLWADALCINQEDIAEKNTNISDARHL
ncbi:hypothetical protein IQ06DRAFT_152619 [Phaeosphaeriaceae sp. SRC1lsM3a]|nr:hypothetical protein IQ06DRAFT_152619 [Stagonospora sp. SRC1lsM3a]